MSCRGGAVAQRGHSANYYGVYPGNTPGNQPPDRSMRDPFKTAPGLHNSGPWDPWLPAVENSRLFAQRGRTARCGPRDAKGPQGQNTHGLDPMSTAFLHLQRAFSQGSEGRQRSGRVLLQRRHSPPLGNALPGRQWGLPHIVPEAVRPPLLPSAVDHCTAEHARAH